MSFYRLPPVGHRIRLERSAASEAIFARAFGEWSPHFYGSGTAALAAAVGAARSGVEEAEVLVPAYGCPDLVSAVVYAGARPVLIDLAPGRPWLDLDALQARLGPRTAAVVGVDLLGIPERGGLLRERLAGSGVVLIQDSAQAFPGPGEAPWWGDLVVLSFGRGKPVSVLGGGAVLSRDPRLAARLPGARGGQAGGRRARALHAARVLAYNRLLSPWVYWLPQAMPFLHLGETRYEVLEAITAMDPGRLALLAANVEAYWARPRRVQEAIAGMLAEGRSDGRVDLAAQACGASPPRLLRYPLLVPPARRGPLLDRLTRAGLGASRMYPAPLPEIPGLERLLSGQGPFPEAAAFSAGLITLPTHEGVSGAALARMAEILATA